MIHALGHLEGAALGIDKGEEFVNRSVARRRSNLVVTVPKDGRHGYVQCR
jgi:hypothetical protein